MFWQANFGAPGDLTSKVITVQMLQMVMTCKECLNLTRYMGNEDMDNEQTLMELKVQN